jgi:hypothetical protein
MSEPQPIEQSRGITGIDEPRGIATEVLGTLVNRAYDRAKRWSGAGLILQVVLFGAGVVAIFWPAVTLSYPWVAVPLALMGAEIARRAATYKGLAETAKRQHEYVVGFGVKPSLGQLADLRQSLQKEMSGEDDELLKKGITYASNEQVGPRRALENLCESSWFTKHLANQCVMWVAATVIIALTIGVSLLLWTTSSLAPTAGGLAAAKSVAASFIFLISVGSIRSWVAYAKLSHKAKDIDSEASRLLNTDAPSAFDVQRLLTEYQVSRASAPLIPTWIWKIHRTSMNADWELRTSKS